MNETTWILAFVGLFVAGGWCLAITALGTVEAANSDGVLLRNPFGGKTLLSWSKLRSVRVITEGLLPRLEFQVEVTTFTIHRRRIIRLRREDAQVRHTLRELERRGFVAR